MLDEAEHAARLAGVAGASPPSAKELAGDRAGAERGAEGEVALLPRRRSAARPTGARCDAAYRLADFYCDDGRWDEAEECLAFYRDVPTPDVDGGRMRLAVEARLAAHRGELAEALTLAAARRRARRGDATS